MFGDDPEAIDAWCGGLASAAAGAPQPPQDPEEIEAQVLVTIVGGVAGVERLIVNLFGANSPEAQCCASLLIMLQHDQKMMTGPIPYTVPPLEDARP